MRGIVRPKEPQLSNFSTVLISWLCHVFCLCLKRDRIKLHCYYDVAIYEGIKECGGYTVLFLLITTEEKSVGHTVFLHLSDGRKECGVHCSSLGFLKLL